MSNILFSVIVPVYNAGKTLHRCVDSLLCQADESVEIILVDDGSSDNSRKLCEDYAEQHENVILISKPNGGVSTARNAGIERASGRYILFVDSDDYVSNQLFSVLQNYTEQNWDYIHFSNCKVSGETVQKRQLSPEEVQMGELLAEKIAEMICKKTINVPWGKAFRREIISDYQIRFPENLSLGEDKVFNLRFLLQSDSYVALNDLLYFVCVDRDDSLSRKQRPDLQNQLDGSLALCRRALVECGWAKEKRKIVDEALNYMELRNIYTMAKEFRRSKMAYKDRLRNIKQLCAGINQKHYQYPAGKMVSMSVFPVSRNLSILIDVMTK